MISYCENNWKQLKIHLYDNIEFVAMELSCVRFTFLTRIMYSGISSFVFGCHLVFGAVDYLLFPSIMMTSSNGNIFRVTGTSCGEFTGHRWFPRTRSFDVFFDLRMNKRLSKQSWGWWFETPSRSLWRHYNDVDPFWRITKICTRLCHGCFIGSEAIVWLPRYH